MSHAVQTGGALWRGGTARLNSLGDWLTPLGLRLILAWEFGEAGLEKLRGSNWFAQVHDKFPFPFNLVPVELSWFLATWLEIAGAIALVIGLFTRLFAYALLVLTFVAVAAVHWPEGYGSLGELWQGYAIRDHGYGNFKLPLLFGLMLLPLVLSGPGKFSLDHLLAKTLLPKAQTRAADAMAWALAGIALGLPIAMLFPVTGMALVTAGTATALLVSWRSLRT